MPTDVYGIPLLPLLALVGGLIGLVKKDFLESIMALFLIAFGLLGVLPAIGVDISGVQEVIDSATTPDTGTGTGTGTTN
ncbi:MAG: hypothetical protein AAFQ73_01545 [Pseudomonadota bacterium]